MKEKFLRLFTKGKNNSSNLYLQNVAIITFLLMFGFPAPAEAYLDPTTGGMIIQIILGGIASLIMIYRLFKDRIQNFLNRWKTKKGDFN